jgi:hypothetical protein
MTRTIHFHIGPHKTGSTAIQFALRKYSQLLEQDYGLHNVDSPAIARISDLLRRNRLSELSDDLGQLASIFQSVPGDCIISCEDLSGDLPGRSNHPVPYPKLYRNINAVSKLLPDFHCKFYFFVRNPDDWIESAYVQLLKYRTTFTSLPSYREFLRIEDLWDKTLEKARSKLNSDFVEIPYREGVHFSSVQSLLQVVLGSETVPELPKYNSRANASPSDDIVSILEAINTSGASNEAKRLAKKRLLEPSSTRPSDGAMMHFPNWQTPNGPPKWLSPELDALWRRVEQRVYEQEQPNLLPDPLGNLSDLNSRLVVASEDFPEGGRQDIENQARILRYRFRGLPETCYLLALSISYLRRRTAHTEHAAFLFQRLWEEEYELLLGILPTRWLISSFQTFLDHGANEAQRLIGASAYFYSNTLKAYEAERAFEGLLPENTYPNSVPVTKSGFMGMDRFKLGGTDLLLNTNALLLELAAHDERAGRVVQEFLVRTKFSHSIFSRMDQSRIRHEVEIPGFSNCWSFFEPPKGGNL